MTAVRGANDAPNILLIEDNKDVRRLFSIILTRAGMKVESLTDGRSALERLDAGPLPDAVVMDRMLPGLPGEAVLSRMRGDKRWADVPVIIVSALRRRFDIHELLQAGATAYLQKPVDTRELVATVEHAIRSKVAPPSVDASLEMAIPRRGAAVADGEVSLPRHSADLIDP